MESAEIMNVEIQSLRYQFYSKTTTGKNVLLTYFMVCANLSIDSTFNKTLFLHKSYTNKYIYKLN